MSFPLMGVQGELINKTNQVAAGFCLIILIKDLGFKHWEYREIFVCFSNEVPTFTTLIEFIVLILSLVKLYGNVIASIFRLKTSTILKMWSDTLLGASRTNHLNQLDFKPINILWCYCITV